MQAIDEVNEGGDFLAGNSPLKALSLLSLGDFL